MSGLYILYPSAASGGGGTLSSVSFSVGALDGQSPTPQGGSVSSNSIFMQSATATFPGLVNSTSQTFSGVKTFTSGPILSSLSINAQVSTNALGALVSSSVSLTSQVTGNLPLSQTQGSLSLTTQVVGVLPAANLPPLSSITGSVSLTTQVSGILPQSNIGSTSAVYLIGSTDTYTTSVNGATIGSSSLYLQSASSAFPGIMSVGLQQFSGLKSFTGVGINTTSSFSALYVKPTTIGQNILTIQGLSGQSSLALNIIDSNNNPKVVYDMNANAFRFNVTAQEPAEAGFDNRAAIITQSISSGSVARFNFFCGQQSAIAAGTGGGIAFGATVTGTTTCTEYGYIWATKNNANAGDDDGQLHFATRNNASGKAQRAMDMDQNGNTFIYGNFNMSGATSGSINLSAGSTVASYAVVLPSAQASGSCFLANDGLGNGTWSQRKTPTITRFFIGSGTYTLATGITYIEVTLVGPGGGGGGAGTGSGNGAAAGSTTSFGANAIVAPFLTAAGGVGASGAGGAGGIVTTSGTASITILNVSGSFGTGGGSVVNTGGGTGGTNPFGGSGAGAAGGANFGQPGISFTGAGGGGASSTATGAGGGGGAGGFLQVIIPAANALPVYSWTVGGGSAGGVTGTAGGAGGTGGSGILIIKEFYN